MKKAKKEQTKTQKIISRAFSAFFALIFVFILGVLVVCMVQITTTGEASLFGYKIYMVLTDSMTPELPRGSYFLARKTVAEELVPGDYVVFISDSGETKGFNVTHAVVTPTESFGDEAFDLEVGEDGVLTFRDLDDTFGLPALRLTPEEGSCVYKGDNGKNYVLTQSILPNAPLDDPVPVGNVRAKFVAKLNFKGLQPFLGFLTSIKGYIILIAVPLVILAVFQVFLVIRKYKTEKEMEEAEKRGESPEQLLAKAKEERRNAEDEIARRAIEEYIKQHAIEDFLASKKEEEKTENSSNNPIENEDKE